MSLKSASIYGEDYGTSKFKFGPIFLGDAPEMVDNRGYFPTPSKVLSRVSGEEEREVVVGHGVWRYLESKEDLLNLIYPMRNGVIRRGDEKAWKVVKELTRYGLKKHAPKTSQQIFRGFYVVAALAAQAPKYMYEKIFDVHQEIDEEEGGALINSVTIIPQPLAVAISHKAVTCVVIESGHGNTQITPISRGVIERAIIPLNRGGSDANAVTAQILRDAGYEDLAKEEKFVTRFKEAIGLLPMDLDRAVKKAKMEPERFRVKYRVEGTTIEVDLEKDSWQRFLIGEYVFDPGHEVFSSYYRRGFPKPRDTYITGEETIPGAVSLVDVIIRSVSKCPVELQPELYKDIILSGGNFMWKVPRGLEDVAIDSETKIKKMFEKRGLVGVRVRAAKNPQYSVWRGTIVYGLYLPEDVVWGWGSMEGWLRLH